MEALKSDSEVTMARTMHRRLVTLFVCICGLAIAGCSGAEPTATPTGQHLRALATAYLDFAVARGRGPANQQQLTRHLQAMPAFALGLSDTNAESLAQLYLSPRDQMPFVIKYGQPISLSNGEVQEVIAHETVGEEGTRYVAYANGQVECIDATSNNVAVLSSAKGF